MSLYCKIKKHLGNFNLDVEFEAENEVLALMGASGCGKSMTLRCIAGVVKPDNGIIVLNGNVLFDSEKKINLSPQQRKTGLLFQDYALFPNMTVSQNISVSSNSQDISQINEIITSFHLNGLENHYPNQLSGGQKQRCALARMIASNPEIIMLDEPFSALDSFLRWQLEQEVASVIKEFGKTVLLVSHNRDEVYRLCNRASIINNGKNEPVRDKHDLYASPRTYNEALLTGCKNILPVEIHYNSVLIPSLGLSFTPEFIPPDTKFAGIRAKKILPAFLAQNLNCLLSAYSIISITENVFTYILMITTPSSSYPLRWEIPKSTFEQLQNYPPVIAIPENEIILLSE